MAPDPQLAFSFGAPRPEPRAKDARFAHREMFGSRKHPDECGLCSGKDPGCNWCFGTGSVDPKTAIVDLGAPT